MKKYYAYWYESDEYDQWLASSEHEDKNEAMQTAFKNASKHGVHLYAEVHETTTFNLTDGPVTTGSWINTADTGKWSGWKEDAHREELEGWQ